MAEKMAQTQQSREKKAEAEAKASQGFKPKKDSKAKGMRTVLGWPWKDLPAICLIFYVSQKMVTLPKIFTMLAYSLYSRTAIPGVSMVLGEFVVAMFEKNTVR